MSAKTYTMKDNDFILSHFGKGLSWGGEENVSGSTQGDYVLKLKDMPDEKKPRERLLSQGPAALSSVELLAIILSSGSKKEGVMELASRVLKEYGDQTLIGKTDAKSLSETLDIPLGKAMQIVACGELGRRYFDRKYSDLPVIRNAQDVHEYVKDMYALPKEHLRGIYLNTHHRIIHDEVISIGTINSNIVHPREVFRPAIQYGAAGVVLVHNHPSGEVVPSQADIEITKQLIEAGKMVGINLIDHVIVSAEKFTSIIANQHAQ
jgi:DNA repair protein RadC